MITVREKIQFLLDALREPWSDIETFGVTEQELDQDVDDLEIGTAVAWTHARVYVIATHVEGLGNVLIDAPRNPGDYLPSWEALGSPLYRDPAIWP